MAASPTDPVPADSRAAPHPPPGLAQLFLGFLSVTVVAFGGVLPIARRALVERYRWVTPEEFTELIGLAQFLPGPNIVNLAVVVGGRFQGPLGALAAFLGLTLVPAVGVVLVSVVFTRYGDIGAVSSMLAGLAAAAAGLVIAMAARMAEPLWRHPRLHSSAIAIAAFLAMTLVSLPLAQVMAVLLPAALALSWWAHRR
ncbi:chromate transporter [Angulomicrobium tetraedrale]|uniref:Chromate transporter n=1 Tax=Ancylobacter tetraedralis TaxID=217068 RepID=A0A839Z6Y3_9HYPH|nr:chromate transporter [Ancylobacter tetraedralis]MBB3770771.1 chromate transporter [Ancylobacter tetraedralis]